MSLSQQSMVCMLYMYDIRVVYVLVLSLPGGFSSEQVAEAVRALNEVQCVNIIIPFSYCCTTFCVHSWLVL